MGLLTFALNVALDGCCGVATTAKWCCEHREMVANDKMLCYWTRVLDAVGSDLYANPL